MMKTAGVDLSVKAERTGLVVVRWGDGVGEVVIARRGLDDAALLDALSAVEWTGIYAPFGWPLEMVSAVGSYAASGVWPGPERDAFRLRRTDAAVHRAVAAAAGRKVWPLSVSSDRVAMRAVRLAALRELGFERSGVRFDRAGADGVVEVHPVATRILWELDPEDPSAEGLVGALEEAAPWLVFADGMREQCAGSEDAVDGLLAALVARAAALGGTGAPRAEESEAAAAEGWIHLPAFGSLGELARQAGPGHPVGG